MKALSYDRYGGIEVLTFTEQPRPVPGKGEVLVAMRATSINVIDFRIRRGLMGFPMVDRRFPKVPAADVAGVVAEVGLGVTTLAVGDAVFGATNPFKGGALAEFVCLPARQLARKPAALTFAEAATLPIAGLAAWHAIAVLGQVSAGQDVLIHGGSGAVGLFALQMAKRAEARVTTVNGASGLAEVLRLGADTALDYRAPTGQNPAITFDVILNASGQMPFGIGRARLRPHGRLVEPSPDVGLILTSALLNPLRRRKHMMLITSPNTTGLERLAQLAGAGQLRATIGSRHTFAEAAEAFARMEAGGVVGKVVVEFDA